MLFATIKVLVAVWPTLKQSKIQTRLFHRLQRTILSDLSKCARTCSAQGFLGLILEMQVRILFEHTSYHLYYFKLQKGLKLSECSRFSLAFPERNRFPFERSSYFLTLDLIHITIYIKWMNCISNLKIVRMT